MLERVSAQAESAASLFVRNFERPYRSSRILDPRFWQNKRTESATSSWWPGYLQCIRDVSQGRQHSPRDGAIASLVSAQHSVRSEFESTALRGSGNYATRKRKRSYTISASTQQKPQRFDELFDLSEEILPEPTDPKTAYGTRNRRSLSRDGQAERLENHEIQQDDALSDISDLEALGRTGSSRGKNETRTKRSERAEDWDLDSSLASLVSPDRMVTLNVDKSSMSIQDSAENESVENEFTKERVVIEESAEADTVVEPFKDEIVNYEFDKEDASQVSEERDERRDALHEYIQLNRHASESDFDEVWRLFSLTQDQEADATIVFRYLAKAKHSKHLNRAISSFRIIPEKTRTASLYRKALDVQLQRYQHREAIDLAFDAQSRDFKLLPILLRHFIDNLLWNSAVELIRRNGKARQDVQKSLIGAKYEAVDYRTLIGVCHDMPDLFSKVTSLAQRLRDKDATLVQNRPLLEGLCKSLVLQCAWSTDIVGRMTREGIIALIELGTSFGVTNLHQSILSTIFRDAHKADKADLALFVYRDYRLRAPEATVNPRMLGSLLSICGAAKSEPHIYGYLLRQFELHCPKYDMFGAYQRVLTSCARQGEVDAVEHFLQSYIANYGKPKLHAMLNPSIHVRAVSGDVMNARKQLERLRDDFGVEPNSVSWNMLILAHARSDNDLSAFEVFDEMLAGGISPDSYTYGTLLSVCAEHADVEAAINLLAESRKLNVAVTVPMINTVVEACLANHDDRQALAFVYAATESGTTEPLVRLWNSMMRYYAFKGDTTSILRLRASMKFYGVKPNDWTYANLLVDLVSRKKTREAIQLLREMHYQEGVPVTLLHYSIILHGLAAEKNRDMAMVIYSEIKQRFPGMAASIDVAMLDLQGQHTSNATSRTGMSPQLNVLSGLLAEASRLREYPDHRSNKNATNLSTTWFQIFEGLLMSFIRNQSYEQAEILLNSLASSRLFSTSPGFDKSVSTRLSQARMELAIAREQWSEVDNIWQSMFQDAKRKFQPLGVRIREVRESSDQNQVNHGEDEGIAGKTIQGKLRDPNQPTRPIQRKWQFTLSNPLNRYITSMGNEGRIDELWKFIQEDFLPSGFQLSGRNWNRYIQVLCESAKYSHHVAAFRLTEKHLINRAQSWKLLTRGLLRQQQTKYELEANKEGKRPVLQKQNSFKVSDRSRFLDLQPSRKIPTYLTFVHLAKVLQQASENAKTGNSRLITAIGGAAPKTKRFTQEMPYMRDRLQGTILRGQQSRPDEKPRPRSESSYRQSVDRKGILGSSSPLDHLPTELLRDIEALVAPRDDVRQVLRRGQDVAFSPRQQRDITIGEQVDGPVNRRPVVLAAKGRYETQMEFEKRVDLEEREKLDSVAKIRQDIRTRRLFDDSYRGRQTLPKLPVTDVPEEPNSKDDTEEYSRLLKQVHDSSQQPALTSFAESLEHRIETVGGQQSRNVEAIKLAVPFERLSVSEQLERLEDYRKTIAERAQKHPVLPHSVSLKGLALPYANIRRVRRALVEREAKKAAASLRLRGLENFQSLALNRAIRPSPLELRQAARQRRAVVRQQEQALKAGQRLPPLPKTLSTMRRSRSANIPPIRFVADLKRKKWRYQVRRGLIPDLRLERFKRVQKDVDLFVPAEEMIKRRHPVLTAIRELDPNFGRRKLRRTEVAAISLGRPALSIKGNFTPISEV